MVDDLASFQSIMERIRGGSQDAVFELIQNYSPHIVRVVRRRLPGVLRTKFDSQDFVQAAWASVFAHRSCLDRFDTPEQFVAYMAVMTRNKLAMEVRRRLQTKKNDVGREQPLEDSTTPESPGYPGPEPTPSQVAIARECWSRMLREVPEQYRKIVEMRFAGATFEEIARVLEVSERTARRVIERLNRHYGVDLE